MFACGGVSRCCFQTGGEGLGTFGSGFFDVGGLFDVDGEVRFGPAQVDNSRAAAEGHGAWDRAVQALGGLVVEEEEEGVVVVVVVVVVVEDGVLDGGAEVGSSRQHAKTPRCQAHCAGLLPTTMAG